MTSSWYPDISESLIAVSLKSPGYPWSFPTTILIIESSRYIVSRFLYREYLYIASEHIYDITTAYVYLWKLTTNLVAFRNNNTGPSDGMKLVAAEKVDTESS